MSIINYQAPAIQNYGAKKSSKAGGLAAGLAAGVAQFGIGMAGAWQKANDAEKAKFPEWWKNLAGYKAKDAEAAKITVPTAPVKADGPVQNPDDGVMTPTDTTGHPDFNQKPASDHPDFTPVKVEGNDQYTPTDTNGSPDFNAVPSDDYAASWNDDTANQPEIQDDKNIHPVDLAGGN